LIEHVFSGEIGKSEGGTGEKKTQSSSLNFDQDYFKFDFFALRPRALSVAQVPHTDVSHLLLLFLIQFRRDSVPFSFHV